MELSTATEIGCFTICFYLYFLFCFSAIAEVFLPFVEERVNFFPMSEKTSGKPTSHHHVKAFVI